MYVLYSDGWTGDVLINTNEHKREKDAHEEIQDIFFYRIIALLKIISYIV